MQEQAKVEALAEEYRLFQDDMEKGKKLCRN